MRLVIEQINRVLDAQNSGKIDPTARKDLLDLLKAVVNHPAMDRLVNQTENPWDNLLLRLARAILNQIN